MKENKNKNEFNQKDEASITVALDSCLDILGLIAKSSFNKGTPYFFESLFIRLRHLSYYLSQDNSPLIQYKNKLNTNDLFIIDKIVNIRIASAHPEADQHWLNKYIMISGAKTFNEGDVEIQYGPSKLLLIKEIIPIYKKLRMTFLRMPEFLRSVKHPYWEYKEQELAKIEQELISLLKNPAGLLKS